MRTAVKLLACSVGLFTLASAQAAAPTNVVSDPVGFYKVTISSGANFISAPLHKVHAYRGTVASTAGDVVTLNGNPAFTVNQFGPLDSRAQYILIVRNDTSANPGIQGDWWNITANAAGTVTLDPAQGAVNTIGAADQVEIRKKTSLADLFGTGATCILNRDADGDPNSSTEDVLRFVTGTSFSGAATYFDDGGSQGYVVDGNGPFTGDTITLDPDEPIMVFRKTGSAATNVVSLGQVHTKRMTHYFGVGANTYANVYPANAPANTSGLKTVMATDLDGDPNQNNEDVIRSVIGTSFGDTITLGDASIFPPLQGATFIVNGNENDNYPFESGKGYIFFTKNSTGGRIWRQGVPFNP